MNYWFPLVVWLGGVAALDGKQDFVHALCWPFFLGGKIAMWALS